MRVGIRVSRRRGISILANVYDGWVGGKREEGEERMG